MIAGQTEARFLYLRVFPNKPVNCFQPVIGNLLSQKYLAFTQCYFHTTVYQVASEMDIFDHLILCISTNHKVADQLKIPSCCVINWNSSGCSKISIKLQSSRLSYTMRRNLPKLSSVLIFWINLLNSSLKNIPQTVKKFNFTYFY